MLTWVSRPGQLGLFSLDLELPEDISQEELIAEIGRLNNDPRVHGILVQLPLPAHMNADEVMKTISVEKDADGFDHENIGNLWKSVSTTWRDDQHGNAES